jgi:hypothetical protein
MTAQPADLPTRLSPALLLNASAAQALAEARWR